MRDVITKQRRLSLAGHKPTISHVYIKRYPQKPIHNTAQAFLGSISQMLIIQTNFQNNSVSVKWVIIGSSKSLSAACSALNYYLNQGRFIIDKTPNNAMQCYSMLNSDNFIQENAFQTDIWKILDILLGF